MSSSSQEKYQQQFLVGTYSSGDLLFIRAITPLHVGVGRAGGVVDLPVQKDLYGYPVIYASSLKGALRSTCLRINQQNKNVCRELFGSPPGETPTQPGKVMVLDAQPLLVPVRLLRGVYGYATSPLLLKRFMDYLEIIDSSKSQDLSKLLENIEIKSDEVLVIDHNNISISIKSKVGGEEQNYVVVNEEFWLKPKEDGRNIIDTIIKSMPDELLQKLGLEAKNLLVVSDLDDVSLQIVEKSLLRLQRIRLKEGEKIVETGALWSEEYVPRNTVFYTLVLYSDNGKAQAFRSFLNNTKKYLILGGNETIGKGLVELYYYKLGSAVKQ